MSEDNQDNQENYQEDRKPPQDIPNNLSRIITEMGNNIFGGRLDDFEYLQDDVSHADRIKMKEDPQIRFGLLVKKFALLGQGWSIDPSRGKRKHAEFVTRNFKREIGKDTRTFETSFMDKLRQILSAIDHGVSITEKVWGRNDQNEVVLKDLKTRENELGDFRVAKDEHGNIEYLEQQTASHDKIPLDKVIVMSYLNNGDEITGDSDLEAVWDAWFRKKAVKEFYSAHLELRSKINTVASVDEGRSLDDGLAEEVWKMLKNMQLGGRMIVPEGVSLDTIDMGQANENLFFKALKYWDGQILKGFLTPHLVGEASTEQSNTGSFALGQTHFSIFLLILKYLKKKLEDKINEEIVRPLIDFNFANVSDYPQFKINAFQNQSTESLANTIKLLVDAGVLDGNEEWIDDFVGLPSGDATKQAMLATDGISGMDSIVSKVQEAEEELKNEQSKIHKLFKNPEDYQDLFEEDISVDDLNIDDLDSDEYSAKCRKENETKEECVSRKVPELIEEEGIDQDQAVAVANSMCEKPCSESDD